MTFPEITVDIIRSVLEICAESSMERARTLVLVSKEVQKWIDPILYRDVVFTKDKHLEQFAYAMSHKPSAFFASHVKRMGFFLPDPVKDGVAYERIASICTGIQYITLWGYYQSFDPSPTSHALQLAAHAIKPRRVCCRVTDLVALLPTILDSVTHLDLLFRDTTEYASRITNLASLLLQCSNLTHLSFNIYVATATLSVEPPLTALIEALPQSISVIIIHLGDFSQSSEPSAELARWIEGQDDPRVVFEGIHDGGSELERIAGDDAVIERGIIWRTWQQHIRDWTSTHIGNKDAWDLADEIVSARMRSGAAKHA